MLPHNRAQVLAVLSLLVACQSPAPETQRAASATTVATYASTYWYEETLRYFQVSADGKRAIYGFGPRGRVVDLATGVIDSAAWVTPLGSVQAAAFDAKGGLVRLVPTNRPGAPAWVAADGTPLTLDAGQRPRWSRDGTRLAAFAPGDSALVLVTPTSRRIALPGAVTGVEWEPTGGALLATIVHDDASTTLLRVDTLGATRTVRDRLDASPAFNNIGIASDGTIYLALAGDSLPALTVRHDPEAPHRDLDIYALSPTGDQLHRVGGEADDDFAPTVVGNALYWTHNDPGAEVVVMPRQGGDPMAVADHGFLPRWSPDSRQIAFTRGYFHIADYGLDMDGWVVALDSAGKATGAPKAWITGFGEDMGPVWSPDGKWVAYHSHRSATAVPLYGSPGRTDDQWLQLTAGGPEIRVTDFGFEVGPPTWSPDGRQLLFDSWVHDGIPRMAVPWITTIDPASGKTLGSRRLPLPKEIVGINGEVWSPKGDRIAMVQRIDDSHQALWTIKPDGGGARKLTTFRAFTIAGVDWSHDGSTLLYAAVPDGEPDHDALFAIDANGGTPHQLTNVKESLLHPQESPDGKLLAASRLRWRKLLQRVDLQPGR
ncbi:MAG: hypothetical protein U0132_19475 [Gemmatimonadaceae bacterium]